MTAASGNTVDRISRKSTLRVFVEENSTYAIISTGNRLKPSLIINDSANTWLPAIEQV
jgi:hypothetical protein